MKQESGETVQYTTKQIALTGQGVVPLISIPAVARMDEGGGVFL